MFQWNLCCFSQDLVSNGTCVSVLLPRVLLGRIVSERLLKLHLRVSGGNKATGTSHKCSEPSFGAKLGRSNHFRYEKNPRSTQVNVKGVRFDY